MTLESGGVTSMDSFLKKFFPPVYPSIGAATVSRKWGRRWSMFFGGALFCVGAILNGTAQAVWMLIFGRILLGFGIGFSNQSVPLYLSEMAPSKFRGALNIVFQLSITVGILAANVLNYFSAKMGGWGWRLSLGAAVVPALIITIGSTYLPNTPNSMIERGQLGEAKAQLRRIRGVDDVTEEFNDLVVARRVKEGRGSVEELLQRSTDPSCAWQF
ncbi:hypothetical protein M0R45_015180 [Rubus argutus]|uniref:Major facilitator superfamily (MFS) profile domain-containing protein n=1 Tax=Rubus argutus TaxID=59490 RepID=A0AAW1XR98_RUBAR